MWLRKELQTVSNPEVVLASDNRPDILVQVTPKSGPVITVVIEVKKSTHKALHHAMQSQLLDLYLRPHKYEGWTHGLYLVAWTPKPTKVDVTNEPMLRAQSRLTEQAEKLSESGLTIESLILDGRAHCKP